MNRLDKPITKKYLKNQESLKLWNCGRSWTDVIKQRDWNILKSLNLSNCQVDDNSLKTLFDFEWSNLTILCLSSNKITDIGINQLSNKKWPKLDSLWLNDNNIGSGELSFLKNFQNKLILLILSNCGIGNKGIQNLLSSDLTNLIRLQLSIIFSNLYKNIFGSIGAKWLAKTNLFNLRKLSIVDCQIGQEGHKHLSKARWPNLNDIRHSDILVWVEGQVKLNTWQQMNKNEWKQLRTFSARQTQPICVLNLAIVESIGTTIQFQLLCIQNNEFSMSIEYILENRKA